MAGRGLGTLTLDLVAKIGGFVGPLDQAERKLKSSTKSMTTSAVAFGTTIGNFLTKAIEGFARKIPAVIDRMDELSKGAQKIGVTTESLSRLAYAADLSDVSLEQLQGGLAKMTKYQAEAAQGGKDAIKTFKAFGIAITDNEGNLRGTQAVLQDFARVFKALPDGPEKTALALRVFGKAGAELIPLLNSGADGLADMAAEADRLGITISTQAGKEAEQFNDDLTRLQAKVTGLSTEIARKLLPELDHLAQALLDLGKNDGGSTFADLIVNELGGVSKAIRGTVVEIEFLKKAWKEQGVFGEGILSVLDRADKEFKRREELAHSLGLQGGPHTRGTARKGAAQGQADLAAAKAAEAARKLLATSSEDSKTARKSVDEVAEAYKRMNAQLEESVALFGKKTEVEKLNYELTQGNAAKFTAEQKEHLLALAQERDLQDALAEKRERDIKLEEEATKAAQDHADSVKQLLDDIAFETSLIGLNNDERERMIALRGLNGDATAAEAAQIEAAMKHMQEAQKANAEMTSAMDEFRGNFSDAVTDVLTGTKSISDAFKDLADQVISQIARMIANNLTASLFGDPGSAGGGSMGGGLSSFFSLFLPHHALGTNFAPGGPSVVGEHGPEIVNLPRGSQVIPNNRIGGHTVNVTVNGNASRETVQQISMKVREALAFAGRAA